MGNCVSLSKKQPNRDVGISSATYQQTNKKPVNRFHEIDSGVSSSTNNNNNNARKAKVVKKPKKKIHKGIIGLPSNFQHTGHIGITELRSGKVDPEKIKNQMAEVAAALSLEGLNIGSSTPEQQQVVIDNKSDNISIPDSLQNDSQFKVKRKPTLTPISLPVQLQKQNSQSSPTSLGPIIDPMAEIVAALKMPVDGNFDKQNDQKLVV